MQYLRALESLNGLFDSQMGQIPATSVMPALAHTSAEVSTHCSTLILHSALASFVCVQCDVTWFQNPPPPPSPPPKDKPQLPPKWRSAKDQDGKTYYYHTETRFDNNPALHSSCCFYV